MRVVGLQVMVVHPAYEGCRVNLDQTSLTSSRTKIVEPEATKMCCEVECVDQRFIE